MATYYTYSEETKLLTTAPHVIEVDGATKILNRPESYAHYLHAYPLSESSPVPPQQKGKVIVSDGYKLNDAKTEWIKQWRYEDAPSPTLEDYDKAMEEHLTEERSARGYTTREPDMYINSSVPRWASDASDWVAHRDAVMLYALGVMNAVESGECDAPTIDEFLAGLPKIVWSVE